MEEPDYPVYAATEEVVHQIASWVKLAIECCGVIVIAWGVGIALFLYAKNIFTREEHDFATFRLTLSRYLIVALEFQLAADIISTAIAPNWDLIGKLAAIATIRTVLNYFLEKEIDAEIEAIKTGDREVFEDRMDEATD